MVSIKQLEMINKLKKILDENKIDGLELNGFNTYDSDYISIFFKIKED